MRSQTSLVGILWVLVAVTLNQMVLGDVPQDSDKVDLKDELEKEGMMSAADHKETSGLSDFLHSLNTNAKVKREDDDGAAGARIDLGKNVANSEKCGDTSLSLVGLGSILLTSPKFGVLEKYEEDLDCSYTITAELGYNLVITIHYMDIEESSYCRYDYLQIYNISNMPVRDKICGQKPPAPFTSGGNKGVIKFVTDGYFQFTGFNLTISKMVDLGTGIPGGADCGLPITVADATMVYTSTTIGAQVKYTCKSGYKMTGNSVSICQANLIWGPVPQCLEMFCGKPIISDPYAIPIYTDTRYGSTMNFSCGGQHMLENPTALLTCGPDGIWIGEMPRCVDINCGDPPPLANTLLAQKNGIYPGDTVDYLCKDGYINNGGQKMVCTQSGYWSPYTDPVQCDPVQCSSTPPAPVNGFIVSENGTSFTSVVTYSCNEGYYLVDVRGSEFSIQCAATGRWDNEPPKCDMSLCGGLIIQTDVNPSGVLTSPNYPDKYSPQRNCTWVIQAPHPGHRITFEVVDMVIEYEDQCKYDRLNIFESNGLTYHKIGTYCGSMRPPKIETLGNFLIVNLYSDDADVYRGFRAEYYFSPARDQNDIQAAALVYYPDLVNTRLMDVKLDHFVEAFSFIRSYKLTVDGMFEHSDCLYLLEAFDGLFHLLDTHVLPDLQIYAEDTLTRLTYSLNPANTTLLTTLAQIWGNNNATAIVADAKLAVSELKTAVMAILGNVTKGPIDFPATSVVFEALNQHLANTIYPNRKVLGGLNAATQLVDVADQEVKPLLNIGIWASPVCPKLVDAVPLLTDAVKTTLDKLVYTFHESVVIGPVLEAFGPDAAHIAEGFHKELTEQLHVLHSPFEILAIAWNRLKDISLAKLNGTNDIGVQPEPGQGHLSEAELKMRSTQPPLTDLYEGILKEELNWNVEKFLRHDCEDMIFMMAPQLLDVSMKTITKDQIQGMLKELVTKVMQKMPGGCIDAKLTAFIVGIVETSLLEIIRVDLGITDLSNAIATIAQSELLVSAAFVQDFAANISNSYRKELHKVLTEEAHKFEQDIEAITDGRRATETIPMLAIIRATSTVTSTFRELISDLATIIIHPLRVNETCRPINYYEELSPIIGRYLSKLDVNLVIDRLLMATIQDIPFSNGAKAYIREQLKAHYNTVLYQMTWRLAEMNFPNHKDLSKQMLIQFILDSMAFQIHQAIALWKPDIPVPGTTSTQAPLPNINPADMVQLILVQQNSLDNLVRQIMLDMKNMITFMGGGLDACLAYPAICSFSINYSLQ